MDASSEDVGDADVVLTARSALKNHGQHEKRGLPPTAEPTTGASSKSREEEKREKNMEPRLDHETFLLDRFSHPSPRFRLFFFFFGQQFVPWMCRTKLLVGVGRIHCKAQLPCVWQRQGLAGVWHLLPTARAKNSHGSEMGKLRASLLVLCIYKGNDMWRAK